MWNYQNIYNIFKNKILKKSLTWLKIWEKICIQVLGGSQIGLDIFDALGEAAYNLSYQFDFYEYILQECQCVNLNICTSVNGSIIYNIKN